MATSSIFTESETADAIIRVRGLRNSFGDQVIHDSESQEEYSQGAGKVRAYEGEDGDGERDVGGGGDRPALCQSGLSAHYGDIDQRWDSHPTDRGSDRDDCGAETTKVADDDFPFELEAHEEEEDRQQAVGSPRS